MKLDRMRCYFLYDVPVTEELTVLADREDDAGGLIVIPTVIDRFEGRPDTIPSA